MFNASSTATPAATSTVIDVAVGAMLNENIPLPSSLNPETVPPTTTASASMNPVTVSPKSISIGIDAALVGDISDEVMIGVGDVRSDVIAN